METYDIYFRDEQDSANKGFNLKDKEKATKEEVWSKPIPKN